MNPKTNRITWDRLRGLLKDNGARPEDLDRFDEVRARRRFFQEIGRGGAAFALLGLGAGSEVAMRGLFGRGLIPEAWAQEADQPAKVAGREAMTVHNTRPVNGEFAPHLLDDDITPAQYFFVRNNGVVPDEIMNKQVKDWSLSIDGEVQTPLQLSLQQLKEMPSVSMPLLIECGGNGRALFEPSVRGNPWGRGAVACGEWKGVRLRDVLEQAGLKDSAVYTGHYGADVALA
ncbi:MAG: molybdopterin-dependent oxidoreductase, partial [Thiohalobacteraceae bacterium]